MSGLFGVVDKKGEDCAKTLFTGIDYHSHLGTQFGGMAIWSKKLTRWIHDISQSQFKSKFYDDYHKMKGDKGIGVISDKEEQPMYINSKFGPFAICTSGLIENSRELMQDLFKQGVSFSELSDDHVNTTELIGKLIARGDDLVSGIEEMFDKIKGSCSVLILTKEGICAARDRIGYTPLFVGENDNSWAVTQETCALPNLDFKVKKSLGPGEIVFINEKGMKQRIEAKNSMQICTFLWIYTGFPASDYEGINTEVTRERCGRALAKNDNIKADLISGVPDSGVAHAIGYAMESKVPYRRPLVKYTPGYGRSYTPPSQETRDLVAKMKLIPIKEVIKGNSIVVCEDSIVRGTQLKNFTVQKLMDAGAKEVHIRPACPPLMFPCIFCLSTRSTCELAARKAIKDIEGKDIEDVSEYIDSKSAKYKKMVDWIAKDLGVTTLKYQTLEDMIKAVGLPKEKLCTYCWDGECPSNNIVKNSACRENCVAK